MSRTGLGRKAWGLWVAAVLLGACADNPKSGSNEGDSGAGPAGDGQLDGGMSADTGPGLEGKQCGDVFCIEKGNGFFPVCCAGENTCGRDLTRLQNISKDIPLTGCIETHGSGVDSDHCGVQYDIIDGDLAAGAPNGKFDMEIGSGAKISFAPCCTPRGECGVVADEAMGQHLDLGCIAASALAPAPTDGGMGDGGLTLPTDDAGLPIIPNFHCDANTGAFACNPDLPAFLPGACPLVDCLDGLPSYACGCGVGEYPTVDLTDAIPGNDNCLPNLSTRSCGCDSSVTTGPDGENDTADDCIADLPMLACGCGELKVPTVDVTGAGYANNCIANVDTDVCGCSAASVPGWICGCGEGVAYSGGIPCLSFKATDACGTGPIDTTGACIHGFDEYVKGCGASEIWDRAQGPSSFCVSNVADTLYGCDDVTTPVENVPSWICGCGEGVPYTSGIPCLSNVATSVCGASAIDTTHGTPNDTSDDCIAGFDEYVQGCGAGTVWDRSKGASSFCVSNQPNTLYGCNDVTQPVANVPAWICGCGEDVPYTSGIPCLSNVKSDVCGATAIDTTGNCLVGFDEYVQGCGAGNVWDRSGGASTFCVSNVAQTFYGCKDVTTAVPNVPAWICGCGDGVPYTGGIPCLSNVKSDVCGATAVDTTGDCLVGFDEYVQGCGETTVWNRAGGSSTFCVSNAASTLYGCKDVTTSPATLPTWFCGCGDGVKYNPAGSNPFPCLSNVATNICGAAAVDTTNGTPDNAADDCVPGFDEYVNGCGTGGTCITYFKSGVGQTSRCLSGTSIYDRAIGIQNLCISNAPSTMYGCKQITSGHISGPPNSICGCGDGVVANGCFANVTKTVCGSLAACTAINTTSNNGCSAAKPVCLDTKPIANADGQGSAAGDGIGDTCARCSPVNSEASDGSNGCPVDGKTYRCDDLKLANNSAGQDGLGDTCTDVTPP